MLQVIADDGLPFQVMLGAYLGAEMNNFGCPWGATYTEEQLEASRPRTTPSSDGSSRWPTRYPDIVFSVAVGNEATVDWTDHFVPVPRMIEYVRRVKAAVRAARHLLRELRALAAQAARRWCAELDFISLHTYPVWEYKHIHEALDYTQGQRAQRGAACTPASPSSSPRPAGAPTATAAACTPNTRRRSCRPSTTRT